MLLFAFVLLLAGGAIALAAVMGLGSAYLQSTYLLTVGALLGVGGLIGLVIALLERSSASKRARRIEEMRAQPSNLQLTPETVQAVLDVASIPNEAAVVAPIDSTPQVFSEAAEPALVEPQTPAVDALAPIEETPSSTEVQPSVVEEIPVAEEVPQSVAALPEPDQTLYLDPEVELSDIKRVLNIWQMTFDENLEHGQIARWVASDGTLIDMFEGTNGFPCFEIRGDMASELAEFLPQDLPIYPELPNFN